MEKSKRERLCSLLYPGLLLVLAGLILALSRMPGALYGSTCDWFAQHVSIAGTMRQTILAEGTLFPGQLPLGGGSNIYDFSYYGYLRPDVLLGCLVPQIPMEYVIITYLAVCYLCSVLLFFLLLKKFKFSEKMVFLGGIMFLCAGCFFQIHRQIMFVNYMTFLVGAFLCVLRYHRTGKKALLILMMVLIEFHSYYYAISCLLVIYLFYLYTSEWPDQGREGLTRWWGLTWRYALWVLTAVAMAAVLLLPTAASVWNCAAAKDGGSAGKNPLEFFWDFSSLLYHPYGLGLTLVALFLLLLSLFRKKSRLLAAGILFSLVCGLIPMALNGFLYNRAKILIPFLPLVLLLCIETLGEFWHQRRKPPLLILPPVAAAAYLQYRRYGNGWVWMDLCLVILLAGILYWRGIKTVGIQIITFRILFMAMCSLIILFAIEVHRNDTMIKEEAANISRFTQAERKGFYQDSGKRFDTLYSPYQTGNALLAYGAGRTTMYTSTANPVYSSFFYDGIKNPIGNNNRVGLFGRGNPFFLYLMGVQYLESPAGVLPAGYEVQQRKGNAVLAEREDVLPLCYGSTELLRLSEYEKLGFPYNIEALTSRSIVKSGKSGFQGFHSHFKELHPKEGVDYEIQPQTKGGAAAWKDFTVIPAEPLEHKILAVDFRVKAKSRSAVVITINGITNKLSGASAPYPNHNEDFTYFLSSPEPIREFSVKTSGTFEIEDLHIYSLDEEKLGKRQVYPLKKDTESPGKAVGAHSGAGREKISGIITLPEDGYFITSFPWQPGYRVWADGKQVPAENVNTAFVGIPLLAGRHKLLITYEPPLERSGMLLSATGWLLWIGIGLWEAGNRRMHKWMVHSAQQTVISQRLRELFAYGIGGVLTTLVNYVIYFGLERLAVHYLLANTLAWAGAVVFSYWVNRKVVFGSGGSWKREFLDFTGLRLLTLGAENLLLYLAVEQLGLRTAVSKILVSVVTVLANYVICKKHIFKK